MPGFPILSSSLEALPGLFPACPHLFFDSRNQNWTQYSKCGLTIAEQSGKIILSLLVIPLLIQSSNLLACFATAAHLSPIFSCLSTRTPRTFSTELFLGWVDSSLCQTPGICFPRCRTLYFSLLNLIRFYIAHSSSLPRSSCRTALAYKVLISPLSLVPLANFIRVHLNPLSR